MKKKAKLKKAAVKRRPAISLCMIVKNELQNLKGNLLPLIPVFSEVVIVDTGSTDGTREFLQTLPKNVRVVDFQWTDSFAEARNQYLKVAAGVWIFWLDADERMEPRDFVILEKCMKKGLNKAWCHYIVEGKEDFQVRLFPNISGVHYVYRCHEQVYQSLSRVGIRLHFFPRRFISIPPPSPISRPINIRLLEMDISENPDHLMAYNWLAREYFASGEYNKGFTLIDNLLSRRDKWEAPDELYIYRFALGLKNHWVDKAIREGVPLNETLLKSHVTDLDLAVAHNNRGTVCRNKGMLDEAISEYKQALAINLNFADAHYNLGLTYADKEMLDEAISEYKQALAINPNDVEAHTGLGIAYCRKGMLDEAISEYKQALAINPNDGSAHNNLAFAYYLKKKYKLAIRHCDRAVELGCKVHPEFIDALKSHR